MGRIEQGSGFGKRIQSLNFRVQDFVWARIESETRLELENRWKTIESKTVETQKIQKTMNWLLWVCGW